jgi:hypothetical protein
MRSIGAVGLLACSAALLIGCGDDDGIPTGDVSRADYMVRADAICAARNRKLQKDANRYFRQFGLTPAEEPSVEQFATFTEEILVPNVQGQIDRLRELEAPEADAERIEAIYDAAQEAVDGLAEHPASFGRDSDPFGETNRLARAYGLEACAAEG